MYGAARYAGGISARGGNAGLIVLACAAFVVGTAEFIVVGVLDVMSRDLGVSISVAGYLVMAYALGISIGAPIVMAVTTQLDRRSLLITMLGVFAAANVVAVLSSDLRVLLFARFVSGTTHGLFVGVASVVAVTLVPQSGVRGYRGTGGRHVAGNRRARAVDCES